MEINSKPYEYDVRIAYADTDRLGVVYYANYFALFERGRTELLRNMGLRYRDLEEQEKVFLPVSEAKCNYFSPAKYDDLVRIKTWVSKLGRASIEFQYEIYDAGSGKKIAEGFTRHPFVNQAWKPVRVPEKVQKLFWN